LPLLGDSGHKAMVDFMRRLPSLVNKPEAILVISAHWEEAEPTLQGSPQPPMVYDYFGFPAAAYEIDYPARGSPDLADRVVTLLAKANLESHVDGERGFDHGLYIPMKLMYPEAQIPCLQLSLVRGLDAALHLAIGHALSDLMDENILIVGSGFSFHNLGAFSFAGGNTPDRRNDEFQEWMIRVCTGAHPDGERDRQLINWEKAPHARYCHPREEHLLPLHVCAGLTERPGELIFDDYIIGKRSVAFLW